MSLVTYTNQQPTMSHYQIAEIVDSRPDSVKRTMKRLKDRGVIELTPMVGVNHLGQHVDEYHVDKRNSYIVVAQLSPEFTATLVDRWQELEDGLKPQLPQTFAEALQLAADQARQLEIAAPKVAFVDNFVDIGTTKTLRETAKILKYPERKMIEVMIKDKVLYRQSGSLLPYQTRQSRGLFEVKVGERNGHAYTQTRVTTKGLEWLGNRYASDLMEDE